MTLAQERLGRPWGECMSYWGDRSVGAELLESEWDACRWDQGLRLHCVDHINAFGALEIQTAIQAAGPGEPREARTHQEPEELPSQ